MRAIVAFTPMLVGCLTEASFGDVAAGTFCRRAQQCDAEAFDAAYESPQACEDLWDAVGGSCFREACDLDAEAANRFVTALGTADCDGAGLTDAPGWADVWTGCSDLERLGCVITEGVNALGGG
jgi:hypothetical protein